MVPAQGKWRENVQFTLQTPFAWNNVLIRSAAV